MASDVSIVNRALARLGASRISVLTEKTENARLAKALYGEIREEALSMHPWNFALKNARLAQLDSSPNPKWTYGYQLPSDCLRVVCAEDNETFEVQGRTLLTDASSINVTYIYRNTDETQYSPGFSRFFAMMLAHAMCYGITNSRTLQADIYVEMHDALADATSSDGQEGEPVVPEEGDWLDVRSDY